MIDDVPAWRYMLANAQRWLDQIAGDRIGPHHTDGVAWYRLRPPGRWHKCWAQSWGSCGPFEMIERCPCGAVRIDRGGPWLDRNWRRRFALRKQRFWGGGPPATEKVSDSDPDVLMQLRNALREDNQ